MENQNPIIIQISGRNPTKISQDLLQLSCLPDEIIIEILIRLPVKSLLKLRCVSKSWLYLLSSPHFINTQVKFSVQDCKNVNLRLAILSSVSGLVGKMSSIYSIVCEKNSSMNVANLDYTLKSPIGSAKFVGSCNGLLCLKAMFLKMILWNPSTGKYKEFQDSFVQRGVSYYSRHGFGYDGSNDDYKVVKIFSFRKDEGKYENVVKIYSSRANSWTMIKGFNSGYVNAQSGVFANGALHWEVSQCRDSGASSEIMTLDLTTETYGIMALPRCGNGNGNGDFSWMLSVLGGCLVACCNYYPDKTDLWVMKKYGVENSWTKLVSLSSPFGRMGHITPLFVSENGDEVLVKLGTDISLYNSRNASYKSLDIHSLGRCLQVQAHTYVESLVSPHVGDK